MQARAGVMRCAPPPPRAPLAREQTSPAEDAGRMTGGPARGAAATILPATSLPPGQHPVGGAEARQAHRAPTHVEGAPRSARGQASAGSVGWKDTTRF